MEIKDVRFHTVAVPRIYHTQVAPMGGHEGGKAGSTYVLMEVMSDDGAVGLGEISDVEPDWGAVDWANLQERISNALVGGALGDRVSLVDEVAGAVPSDTHRELHTAVRAAVETALLDVLARSCGLPLYDLLGGRRRERLPITWVAFIRDDGSIEDEVREKAAEGFGAYKLKVGADHDADLDRIRAVREIAGPDAHVRVDASGEWSVDEAIEKLAEMAALGVDAVETPVQAAARSVAKNAPERVNENVDDVAAELAKVKTGVPVRVIEHVSDFDDAFAAALCRHDSVDVFNVLPGQAGGLYRAQRLIHLAEANGLAVLLGSTVELSPGTAAALHLGIASTAVSEACDLVGPGLLVDDVCEEPLAYRDGTLDARGPGLGVDLSEDAVRRLSEGIWEA